MANTSKAAAPPLATPTAVLNAADYTKVVITKTGDWNGLTYRRGLALSVDAVTLAALKTQGLIDATAGGS